MNRPEMTAYESALRLCQNHLSDLAWRLHQDRDEQVEKETVLRAVEKAQTTVDDLLQATRTHLFDQPERECDSGEAKDACPEKSLRLAPESAWVSPNVVGDLVIGAHSDLNGEDATIVDSFEPTRGELITLGLHHLHRYYMERLNGAYGYSGSHEWRVIEFSGGRFDRIDKALGGNVPEFATAVDRYEVELELAERECEEMRSMCRAGSDASVDADAIEVEPDCESLEGFIQQMKDVEDEVDAQLGG